MWFGTYHSCLKILKMEPFENYYYLTYMIGRTVDLKYD